MTFRRLSHVSLALVLLASMASGQTKISLDERVWVASKIYASIPIYFAHWQPVRDLDLDAAYKDYLKAATAAELRWDFDLLTLEFLARLKNGHTGFEDSFLNRAAGPFIGFSAVPVEGKWTVLETYTDKLKVGDVIERIDRYSMDAFFAAKRKYISASSDAAAQRVFCFHSHLFPMQFRLHLASGADIAIDRATQELHAPERRPLEARWITEPSLAYIKIQSFDGQKYEDFALDAVKQYRNARTILFDVRGNGGGGAPERLLRAIIDRPYRDWSQSSAATIGLFRTYSKLPEMIRPGELSERDAGYYAAFTEFAAPQLLAPGALIKPADPIYRGKILVLTDIDCASACEDFVMPLKYSGRATIVGERTHGSSGQPFLYDFGNGMSFRISSRRMYFPDGSEFEGVGIVPDVEVKPSIADRAIGKTSCWSVRSGWRRRSSLTNPRKTTRRSVSLLLLMLALMGAASAEDRADQLVVNKAKRELLLYRGGRVIRSYKVALGKHPVGPKLCQGDSKTPEGTYSISGRNAASAYHRSLRVSYPNTADRARAKHQGVDPGGDIMIHGLPNGQGAIGASHRLIDWTDGCIAVTDAEIEEIWRLVADVTPIRINP